MSLKIGIAIRDYIDVFDIIKKILVLINCIIAVQNVSLDTTLRIRNSMLKYIETTYLVTMLPLI